MGKRHLLALSAAVVLAAASTAGAQFGPPPPGSVQGTESGTYGSSIGFDVRGTAPVDRYGRPNDLMNPTDTGRKSVDPRETREKRDESDTLSRDARGSGDTRSNAPGASMNPGLTGGAAGGSQPSVSPNLNPGITSGTGSAGRPGAAVPGSAGTSGSGSAPVR